VLFVFRRGANKLAAARPLSEDASIVLIEEPVPA
jgi:hypothetical protein